ncbi:MAG: class I SAM-dependent methyltransferase [Actinobacteria bacterium]|nr:class I SAM-dependent methyltransferase [Actinomycetota bacterium]
MSLILKIRDIYYPRKKVLSETGIKKGYKVLDFGCGPGGYIRSALDLMGSDGKLYALDASASAIMAVEKMVKHYNLSGVETIQSDLDTGLKDECVDVILLYDVFHHIENQVLLLRELHRVLKTGGILSFSDHHMKGSRIVSSVEESGLFNLSSKGKKTYSFVKSSR